MVDICYEEIRDATVWTRADFAADTSWIIHFDAQELVEVDRARERVAQSGFRWGHFGRGDFPLPMLSTKLQRAAQIIREGRGFVLFRGLPVERYSLDELKTIYWGLGVHFGRPMGQNRKADLIAHVEDYGDAPASQPGGRGYRGTGQLNPHADYTDMVGLLCVRKATQGGLSSIVSSTAIHNHILREHPEYLPVLYAGMHTTLRNEGPTRAFDEPSPFPVPIFEYYNKRVSCFYARGRYLGGQGALGKPFTELQLQALDYVWEVAQQPEYNLEMDLVPGDIQFLHNHTVLHSRTAYIDSEDPRQKRLMLRLWVRFDEEDYRVSPFRSYLLRWGQDDVRATLV